MFENMKEKVKNIDVAEIVSDLKTNLELLDMGNLLAYGVRAAEKIDVPAIKQKFNDAMQAPVLDKIKRAGQMGAEYGGMAVDYVVAIVKDKFGKL